MDVEREYDRPVRLPDLPALCPALARLSIGGHLDAGIVVLNLGLYFGASIRYCQRYSRKIPVTAIVTSSR